MKKRGVRSCSGTLLFHDLPPGVATAIQHAGGSLMARVGSLSVVFYGPDVFRSSYTILHAFRSGGRTCFSLAFRSGMSRVSGSIRRVSTSQLSHGVSKR